jgi:1-aminocyclopropane-1-carboxylate deaminase/D-cysteine desulfhydrase-like pyridoxal-dependent ACC family enzyme
VRIVADQLGAGYAEPTAAGRAAAELFRAHAGLELDLSYGAKAFAAVVAEAPKHRGRVVLFWISGDTGPR